MLCEGKQGYRERKRHDHIDQIVERQRAKQCVSEERRHNRAEPAASRGGDPPQGDDPNRLTGTTIGRGVRSSAIFSFPRDTQASIRAEAENTQRCKPCPASSCASALSPPRIRAGTQTSVESVQKTIVRNRPEKNRRIQKQRRENYEQRRHKHVTLAAQTRREGDVPLEQRHKGTGQDGAQSPIAEQMHDFRQNPAGNAAVSGEGRAAITTERHAR